MLFGELAFGDRAPEQDLDVDLMVRCIDAGGVIDSVGVDPPARQCVLDATELSEPEVAAFRDHFAPELGAVDAQRVVGAIADLSV